MTKREMLDKILDIHGVVEDLISQAENLNSDLRHVMKKLDELPQEVDEIDEDEKDD